MMWVTSGCAATALVLAAACGGSGGGRSPAPESVATADVGSGVDVGSADGAGTMTAATERGYVAGAALSDAAALQAWLDAAGDRLVKLPVIVDYDGIGYRDPRIAVLNLPITLDDSALGVGLADRVRVAGNGGAQAWLPIVGLWLEGTWRAGTLHVDRAGAAGPPADVGNATHALIAATP